MPRSYFYIFERIMHMTLLSRPQRSLLRDQGRSLAHSPSPPSKRLKVTAKDQKSALLTTHVPALKGPHAHDHGALMLVDLDEAAHAGYVVASQGQKTDGLGGMGETFTEDAERLNTDPAGYLIHEGTPHSVGDVGVAAGLSVGVIFLSYLAIKAGAHEYKQAKALKVEITKHAQALRANQDMSKEDIKAVLSFLKKQAYSPESADMVAGLKDSLHLLQNTNLTMGQRLLQLSQVWSMTQADQAIGASSFISGAGIAAKSTIDTTTVMMAAASEGFNYASLALHGLTNPGVATAVGGLSAVSSVFLGPLAATGALCLGAFFVHKSNKQYKRWQNGRPLLQELKATQENQETTYLKFLEDKSQQREKFFKTFRNWNGGFVAGASLYTGATLSKAIIVTLATTGVVAAAANPVGLGILLGGAVVAGIVMGVCSQQFLHMHETQKRYDGYMYQDDPWVDRFCLLELDAYGDAQDTTPYGLALRETTYDALTAQNRRSQIALQTIADASNQMYTWKTHLHQEKPQSNTRIFLDKKSKLWRNIKASIHADQEALSLLAQRYPLKAARAKRAEIYGAEQTSLNHKSVYRWMEKAQNYPTQIDYMRDILELQRAHLQAKKTTLERALPDLTQEEKLPQIGILGNWERDQALLKRIEDLLENLPPFGKEWGQMSASDKRALRTKITNFKEAFLIIQKGVLPKEGAASKPQKKNVNQRFAKWLSKTQNKQYQDQRGIVLELELEAAHLRKNRLEGIRRRIEGSITHELAQALDAQASFVHPNTDEEVTLTQENYITWASYLYGLPQTQLDLDILGLAPHEATALYLFSEGERADIPKGFWAQTFRRAEEKLGGKKIHHESNVHTFR